MYRSLFHLWPIPAMPRPLSGRVYDTDLPALFKCPITYFNKFLKIVRSSGKIKFVTTRTTFRKRRVSIIIAFTVALTDDIMIRFYRTKFYRTKEGLTRSKFINAEIDG